MTCQIYRDIILQQHMRLFRGAMIEMAFFSLDLNSIELAWDMLGRQFAASHPPPTSFPKLRKALIEEWDGLAQMQLDNLVLSMPRRCTECLAAHCKRIAY